MNNFLHMALRWRSIAKQASFLTLLFVVTSQPTFAQIKPMPEEEEFKENKQKGRLEWFNERLTAGTIKDPAVAAQVQYEAFKSMRNVVPAAKGNGPLALPAWQSVGGSQHGRTSGRATAIGFDPVQLSTLYLGTAQGGLFKSTDKGDNWVSITEDLPTLAVGAVAVDQNEGNIIYLGTGDIDGQAGAGIFKSTDGGLNWQQIATANDVGQKTVSLEIDPMNSNNIFHGGAADVHRSTDGGVTWEKVLSMSGPVTVEIDPQDGRRVYASGNSKIMISDDGGTTWREVGATLPNGTIIIAIARSNPRHLYASISSGGGVVAQSTDRGETWSSVQTGTNYLGQQGWYANAIAVSRTNENQLVVGGLDIYRSSSAGKSFFQSSWWTNPDQSNRYTHADIQILKYGPDALYALTDGGVFLSVNDGQTWQQYMNRTLNTLQFVGVDASNDLSIIAGGAQDNGVNVVRTGETYFSEALGGDGGHTYVQPNGQVIYSTYIQANLRKSVDGGLTWEVGQRGDHNMIGNDSLLIEGAPFYMSYGVWDGDPGIVAIAGTRRIWLTQSGGGDGFFSISRTNTIGSGPTVVAINPIDPAIILAGGKNRYSYLTTDMGNWTRSSNQVGFISGIVWDPNDNSKVYVSANGLGVSHFGVSTDGGLTWRDPSTNFPNVNANSIAIAPNGVLYVALDKGVVFSGDGGKTWTALKNGLPLAQVMSVSVRGQGSDLYLVAGTYGRGAYKINISSIEAGTQGAVESSDATLAALTIKGIYPNPLSASASRNAVVKFELPEAANVRLSVYDELGREVYVIAAEHLPAGEFTRSADLSSLASGKYLYALTALGKTITQSVVLTK